MGDPQNSRPNSRPEGEIAELERLRAIGAWMQETGVSRLALPDGLVVELAPHAFRPLAPRREPVDPEIAEAVANETAEERREREAEAAHYAYWRRLTASSGAPIPPFRKSRVVQPAAPVDTGSIEGVQ